MTADLPPLNEQPANSAVAPRKDRVRWIVAIHIIGIAGCLMFTLADRGVLVNERVSQFFYPSSQLPGLLFCLPLLLCPLWLLIEIVLQRVTGRSAVLAVIAETLLCWTHLQVLLPAIGEYAP